MMTQLKKIIAQRDSCATFSGLLNPDKVIQKERMVVDEVVQALTILKFDSEVVNNRVNPESIELSPAIVSQVRDCVSVIASRYRDKPFHNFEHASHVTMSVCKLLNRIIGPDAGKNEEGEREVIAAELHDYTYGITSDALSQFAVVLAALIHDVDHTGVGQLSKENPEMGEKYKNRSVTEQNSIDIAWDLLMEPQYADLQLCIFTNEDKLRRFRQLIVNVVMATDIFDKESKAFRNQRWDKAFHTDGIPEVVTLDPMPVLTCDSADLKATIVIEHIIQASDVAHTMQHWHIDKKWNERLFQEMYLVYDEGRSDKDPSEGWYNGELWFFDNYIISLAEKLDECRVFGVSSDECLIYAVDNRKEWAMKGLGVVQEMITRYKKRKALELDGLLHR
jgi:hypothetical protein